MSDDAYIRDIHGREAGAFGFFDRGGWRVTFEEVDVRLPEGLNRDQAEAILNLIAAAYQLGRSEGANAITRELAYRRHLDGNYG
jgi:hypothetical protein